MFPHKDDYFTRGTAEQIVSNNCIWELQCLTEDKINPMCPKEKK